MTDITKKVIWSIAAVIIGVGSGLAMNYWHSFKKINVTLGANIQASIYKDLGGDNAYNYNTQSQPLFKLSGNQTLKLKKAVYDIVVSDPSHQYENPITKFVVADDTNSLTVNPIFTDQQLANLLSSQRPAIQQTVLANYPTLSGFYTISSDDLYQHGEWYGAVLQPTNPSVDELKLIMEKVGDSWVVKATPQISIGMPSNPDIPAGVIDSVDQL